jgi:hypothetical protein
MNGEPVLTSGSPYPPVRLTKVWTTRPYVLMLATVIVPFSSEIVRGSLALTAPFLIAWSYAAPRRTRSGRCP